MPTISLNCNIYVLQSRFSSVPPSPVFIQTRQPDQQRGLGSDSGLESRNRAEGKPKSGREEALDPRVPEWASRT
jgi:hypothetical protein